MFCAAEMVALLVGADQVTPDDIYRGFFGLLLIAPVVVAGYAILYRRFVPRRRSDIPQYLREPPAALPPAVVGLLFSSGPTPEKLAATLLDLVRRGVIEMQVVRLPGVAPDHTSREDRVLRRRRDAVAGMRPFEAAFVYELFDHIGGGRDEILLSTVRGWWAVHPATAAVVAGYWSLALRRDAEELGLIQTAGSIGKAVLLIYGFAVCCLTVVTFPLLSVWGFLLMALGFVMCFATQRVTGLTTRGEELASLYGAFRRFLEDFGRMQDKPAEAVVLWERYLTLAIVLGLATEAMDDLYIEPPTFGDYGRAGRAGRGRPLAVDAGGVYADADEALRYAAFRRSYDASLPEVRIAGGVFFEPPIDQGIFTETKVNGRVVQRRTISGFMSWRSLLWKTRWFVAVPVAMTSISVAVVLLTQ